jgi:2-polyprenyl-3-methyl-5-hydroxy-6-metoxy-1,4-benzoquinol methylase
MTPYIYHSSGRDEIQQLVPKHAYTSLDIGCGTGEFSRQLKLNSSINETWGIEIVADAAHKAAHHLDNIICGDVEHSLGDVPDNHFDCIFFNDVLEHLPDPEGILKAVKKKLSPNGFIIASIPNIRHYKTLYRLIFQADWQYEDSGVLDRTHIKFFTKKTMVKLFEHSGYNVQSITGLNGTRKGKIRILGPISLGLLDDIKFLQFGIVAHPNKQP